MQVQGCRVSTEDASKRTILRRNMTISTVREIVSGGDSSGQLAAKIQTLSKSEREDLLSQAQLPIIVPADYALAMKDDLAILWTKLRIFRRYLT